MQRKYIGLALVVILLIFGVTNPRFIGSNMLTIRSEGENVGVRITRGPYWFHQIAMIITATPTYAIWFEDLDGNFISTYYVTKKFYQWTRTSGDNQPEKIEALPHWWHKQRGTLLTDAVTAATPQHDLRIKSNKTPWPEKVVIKMEINNSFDYNEYYTQHQEQGTIGTKEGGQPALVYSAVVKLSQPVQEYEMILVGHSSPDGSDGGLYSNIDTMTTARQIVDKIIVTRE